jgi:uncharacterized protein YdiU (UPF0061 family)
MSLPTFANRYLDEAPDSLYRFSEPTPAPDPAVLMTNRTLGDELGLDADALGGSAATALWSGTRLPEGTRPIALAYAGHQFGQPVPRLGDGRAIMLGQITDHCGRVRDLQLKGCGRTAFSRGGDGLAAIGPVLREYLVSESMHALGIPTTRALVAATRGAMLTRQFGPEPDAVLTRVAASHLRFGSFEYLAHRGDTDALQTLVDMAVNWHDPDLRDQPPADRAAGLLERVIERTARLVSEWLRVGFIHGVMNTDNMAISGETLDYGPCAFMDGFRPDRVYSSIDANGRYAWNQQPRMAHWNLTRLAECLVPLLDDSEAGGVERAERQLATFTERFDRHYHHMLAAKLGLADRRATSLTGTSTDAELAERFLGLMASHEADFTNAWRALADGPPDDPAQIDHMRRWFGADERLHRWLADYAVRLGEANVSETQRRERMRQANPAIIPRNHRIEAALAAARAGDMAPARRLEAALALPYEASSSNDWLRTPPAPDEIVPATFCGT